MRKKSTLYALWLTVITMATTGILAESAEYRTFTNQDGKTIVARVVKVDTDAGKVQLQLKNHKMAWVELGSLSPEDQKYIKSKNEKPPTNPDNGKDNSQVDAKVYLKGSRTYLKEEHNLFDDQHGGQVKTVPEKFRRKMINTFQTKAGRHEKLREPIFLPVDFKVTKTGHVYIIADSRESKKFVNDGWLLVAEGEWGCMNAGGEWDERRAREYHILTKHFEAGEYTLPTSIGIGTRVIVM